MMKPSLVPLCRVRRALPAFLALTFWWSAKISAASPEVAILPMGDSLTRGSNAINYPNGDIPGGYRRELGTRLSAAGVACDFVGGSTENAFPEMDPDHRGYDGLRTDQMLANAAVWLAVNPDVVLLHVGTNDILQDVPVSTAASRLATLIDTITSGAPERRLFVATIIPITQQSGGRSAAYLNGNVNSYNVQVRNLAQQAASAGRKVFLVEMNGGVVLTDPDPAKNFFQPGDGIHPGEAGYRQMGVIWFNALVANGPLVPAPPAGVPAAPSALALSLVSGSRINVSWQDHSAGESGFALFRKMGFSGAWEQIAALPPETTICAVPGLLAGASRYSFAVRAWNPSGDSAWSNVGTSIPVNVALGKSAAASSMFAGDLACPRNPVADATG